MCLSFSVNHKGTAVTKRKKNIHVQHPAQKIRRCEVSNNNARWGTSLADTRGVHRTPDVPPPARRRSAAVFQRVRFSGARTTPIVPKPKKEKKTTSVYEWRTPLRDSHTQVYTPGRNALRTEVLKELHWHRVENSFLCSHYLCANHAINT